MIHVLIATIFILTSPVAAKDKQPIGDYLDWGPTEWQTETPFHIRHGWIWEVPLEVYLETTSMSCELMGSLTEFRKLSWIT